MKLFRNLLIGLMLIMSGTSYAGLSDAVWTKASGSYIYRWVPFETLLKESPSFANRMRHDELTNLYYSSSGHTGFMSDSGDTATGDYTFIGKGYFTNTYASVTSQENTYYFGSRATSLTSSGNLRTVYINSSTTTSSDGGYLTGLAIRAENAGSGHLNALRGIRIDLMNSYDSTGPYGAYGVFVNGSPAPNREVGYNGWHNYHSEIYFDGQTCDSDTAPPEPEIGSYDSYLYGNAGAIGADPYGIYSFKSVLDFEDTNTPYRYSFYSKLNMRGDGTHMGFAVDTGLANDDADAVGVYSNIGQNKTFIRESGRFMGSPVIIGTGDSWYPAGSYADGDLLVKDDLIAPGTATFGDVYVNGDVYGVPLYQVEFSTVCTITPNAVTSGNITVEELPRPEFIITDIEICLLDTDASKNGIEAIINGVAIKSGTWFGTDADRREYRASSYGGIEPDPIKLRQWEVSVYGGGTSFSVDATNITTYPVATDYLEVFIVDNDDVDTRAARNVLTYTDNVGVIDSLTVNTDTYGFVPAAKDLVTEIAHITLPSHPLHLINPSIVNLVGYDIISGAFSGGVVSLDVLLIIHCVPTNVYVP